jgi:hypothetical protein
MSDATTRAPSATNANAVARPIQAPAPVTMTDCPESRCFDCSMNTPLDLSLCAEYQPKGGLHAMTWIKWTSSQPDEAAKIERLGKLPLASRDYSP